MLNQKERKLFGDARVVMKRKYLVVCPKTKLVLNENHFSVYVCNFFHMHNYDYSFVILHVELKLKNISKFTSGLRCLDIMMFSICTPPSNTSEKCLLNSPPFSDCAKT